MLAKNSNLQNQEQIEKQRSEEKKQEGEEYRPSTDTTLMHTHQIDATHNNDMMMSVCCPSPHNFQNTTCHFSMMGISEMESVNNYSIQQKHSALNKSLEQGTLQQIKQATKQDCSKLNQSSYQQQEQTIIIEQKLTQDNLVRIEQNSEVDDSNFQTLLDPTIQSDDSKLHEQIISQRSRFEQTDKALNIVSELMSNESPRKNDQGQEVVDQATENMLMSTIGLSQMSQINRQNTTEETDEAIVINMNIHELEESSRHSNSHKKQSEHINLEPQSPNTLNAKLQLEQQSHNQNESLLMEKERKKASRTDGRLYEKYNIVNQQNDNNCIQATDCEAKDGSQSRQISKAYSQLKVREQLKATVRQNQNQQDAMSIDDNTSTAGIGEPRRRSRQQRNANSKSKSPGPDQQSHRKTEQYKQQRSLRREQRQNELKAKRERMIMEQVAEEMVDEFTVVLAYQQYYQECMQRQSTIQAHSIYNQVTSELIEETVKMNLEEYSGNLGQEEMTSNLVLENLMIENERQETKDDDNITLRITKEEQDESLRSSKYLPSKTYDTDHLNTRVDIQSEHYQSSTTLDQNNQQEKLANDACDQVTQLLMRQLLGSFNQSDRQSPPQQKSSTASSKQESDTVDDEFLNSMCNSSIERVARRLPSILIDHAIDSIVSIKSNKENNTKIQIVDLANDKNNQRCPPASDVRNKSGKRFEQNYIQKEISYLNSEMQDLSSIRHDVSQSESHPNQSVHDHIQQIDESTILQNYRFEKQKAERACNMEANRLSGLSDSFEEQHNKPNRQLLKHQTHGKSSYMMEMQLGQTLKSNLFDESDMICIPVINKQQTPTKTKIELTANKEPLSPYTLNSPSLAPEQKMATRSRSKTSNQVSNGKINSPKNKSIPKKMIQLDLHQIVSRETNSQQEQIKGSVSERYLMQDKSSPIKLIETERLTIQKQNSNLPLSRNLAMNANQSNIQISKQNSVPVTTSRSNVNSVKKQKTTGSIAINCKSPTKNQMKNKKGNRLSTNASVADEERKSEATKTLKINSISQQKQVTKTNKIPQKYNQTSEKKKSTQQHIFSIQRGLTTPQKERKVGIVSQFMPCPLETTGLNTSRVQGRKQDKIMTQHMHTKSSQIQILQSDDNRTSRLINAPDKNMSQVQPQSTKIKKRLSEAKGSRPIGKSTPNGLPKQSINNSEQQVYQQRMPIQNVHLSNDSQIRPLMNQQTQFDQQGVEELAIEHIFDGMVRKQLSKTISEQFNDQIALNIQRRMLKKVVRLMILDILPDAFDIQFKVERDTIQSAGLILESVTKNMMKSIAQEAILEEKERIQQREMSFSLSFHQKQRHIDKYPKPNIDNTHLIKSKYQMPLHASKNSFGIPEDKWLGKQTSTNSFTVEQNNIFKNPAPLTKGMSQQFPEHQQHDATHVVSESEDENHKSTAINVPKSMSSSRKQSPMMNSKSRIIADYSDKLQRKSSFKIQPFAQETITSNSGIKTTTNQRLNLFQTKNTALRANQTPKKFKLSLTMAKQDEAGKAETYGASTSQLQRFHMQETVAQSANKLIQSIGLIGVQSQANLQSENTLQTKLNNYNSQGQLINQRKLRVPQNQQLTKIEQSNSDQKARNEKALSTSQGQIGQAQRLPVSAFRIGSKVNQSQNLELDQSSYALKQSLNMSLSNPSANEAKMKRSPNSLSKPFEKYEKQTQCQKNIVISQKLLSTKQLNKTKVNNSII